MGNNSSNSKEKAASNTPYDDVFRTLLNDCSELIIPVINEVFSENYTGDERIVFGQNEHFLNQQDGAEEKRITDTSFTIVGKESRRYLCECQSRPDSSMLVRLFEYASQIALDEGEITEDTLEVTIPNSAVLFLRSTGSTPDKMKVKINTPGGTVVYDVMVMKAKNYTLKEIFEKKLLFLIPFYIFTYESGFAEYNSDAEKLNELKKEYIVIMDRLDALLERKMISAYIRKTIIEMSEKVVDNLAKRYENIREGVKSVMGGRILEHEAKTIKNEGKAEGKAEGFLEALIVLVKAGKISVQEAASTAQISEEAFREKMKVLM